MNRREPEMAATTNAVHVQGSTSRHSSVTGRLFDPSPSNLKSTIAIVPNTKVIAMTWIVSMVGKPSGDCWTKSETFDFSSQLNQLVTVSMMSCSLARMALSLNRSQTGIQYV